MFRPLQGHHHGGIFKGIQIQQILSKMFMQCGNTILPIKIAKNVENINQVRGGADKSLAQPGRKQATVTKLGIYSTYSPTKLNALLSPLL